MFEKVKKLGVQNNRGTVVISDAFFAQIQYSQFNPLFKLSLFLKITPSYPNRTEIV